MEVETIERYAKNVIKEVMKKVHNKDYEGVEGVVDKVEMGIENFIGTMKCIEKMMDSEDSIDEVSDDEEINFLKPVGGVHYRAYHLLKTCGDDLFIAMEFEFLLTETGIISILQAVNA